MEEAERFAIRGVNGTLVVTPGRVFIKRRRALVSLDRSVKNDKEIAIGEIVDARIKAASPFINGYIQFSLVADAETRGGGFAAAQDENSIMFTSKQQPGFEKAKELVERHREAARQTAPGSCG
ncbi:MAG TPA: hypothetical protein VFD50_05155 [Thermoleophilia bacterium]|nr:hypothetical protein [Thermoleophilia bacterium]